MNEKNGNWKKMTIIIGVAVLGWFATDYLSLRTRATILETNYENIMVLLEKIEKKVDALDPDFGPPKR